MDSVGAEEARGGQDRGKVDRGGKGRREEKEDGGGCKKGREDGEKGRMERAEEGDERTTDRKKHIMEDETERELISATVPAFAIRPSASTPPPTLCSLSTVEGSLRF